MMRLKFLDQYVEFKSILTPKCEVTERVPSKSEFLSLINENQGYIYGVRWPAYKRTVAVL